MPGIPLIFVLSANPDPIGLAIKHQYGLNTKGGEYEAKRILEKFVDSYIDMSAPTELEGYVEALWKTNRTTIDDLYVQKIDKWVNANFKAHRVKNAKVLNTIRTSNSLYSNFLVPMLQRGNVFSLVPMLQRGNVFLDVLAFADCIAGAMPYAFPRRSVGTRKFLT